MKNVAVALLVFFAVGSCFADETHHHGGGAMGDSRISLALTPEMKQHQLSNMRSHVEAVRSIVALIGTSDFEKASEIAHSKLGLTEEMRKMCTMFGNPKFNELGLAFHQSGDALGDVLLKKNVAESLGALSKTMGYCVECHATFRQ